MRSTWPWLLNPWPKPARGSPHAAAAIPSPSGVSLLFREHLGIVGESLELQGVARRIGDEQGRLLACLAGEPGGWLDEKSGAFLGKALGQGPPGVQRQD